MSKYTIRVGAEDLRIIKDHMIDGKKIQAIKHARLTGRQHPGEIIRTTGADGGMIDVTSHKVGLKTAKHACEALIGQMPMGWSAEARFAPTLKIVSIKIETEDGLCEVDIDGLRLRLLDGMTEMSLSEMAHMTELAAYVANWQNINTPQS